MGVRHGVCVCVCVSVFVYDEVRDIDRPCCSVVWSYMVLSVSGVWRECGSQAWSVFVYDEVRHPTGRAAQWGMELRGFITVWSLERVWESGMVCVCVR